MPRGAPTGFKMISMFTSSKSKNPMRLFLAAVMLLFAVLPLAKAEEDMGDASDKQLLQPLFSHPSEGVREVATYFSNKLEKKVVNLATPSSEESAETPSAETNIGKEPPPSP